MKKIHFLILLIFIILFEGCTKPYKATVVTSKEYYKKVTKLKPNQKRPTLGIALSGGGSKAAPFAMGVLKQFIDKDWIDNVDIISSVSGGGYSAYYFYNKAIYFHKQKNPNLKMEKFFSSCELDKLKEISTFKEYNSTKKECSDGGIYGKYGIYQKHVKKYQDLLSHFESEDARGETHWDEIKSVGIVIESFASSLVTFPFHHLFNTLFDWKTELSPSQDRYKDGIVRAFGEVPESQKTDNNGTFEELRVITKNGKVPLWIINTSNFKKTWLQDIFVKNGHNLDKTIFELTPYGFGSGEHNYSLQTPTNLFLDLPRATLASAAFFDALSESKLQGLAFGILHFTNLRWGVKIPNYTTSINRQKVHNLIPLPFYYSDMNSSKITLADGGQSGDNLGLYSLIKRGTKNIVIVSGSEDRKKDKLKMEDMCSVSRFLKDRNLTVWFTGRPDKKDDNISLDFYDTFCKKDENLYQRISYYKWQKPIWKGYIRDKDDKIISKLFLIKAAIDKHDLTQNARVFNENGKCKEKTEKYICTNDNKYVSTNPNYPNSLLSFWILGAYGKSTSSFPQTSTVLTTLNNSKNLYQAYIDLGFYLSGALAEDEEFKKSLD